MGWRVVSVSGVLLIEDVQRGEILEEGKAVIIDQDLCIF
jgi:hypothetical protein